MSKKLDKITPLSEAQLVETHRRILALPIEDRLELEVAAEIARQLFKGKYSVTQTDSGTEYLLQELLITAKERCLKAPESEREAEIRICAEGIVAEIIPEEQTSSNSYHAKLADIDVREVTSNSAPFLQIDSFLQLCLLVRKKSHSAYPTMHAISVMVEMKKASLDDPIFDSSIVLVRRKTKDYRKNTNFTEILEQDLKEAGAGEFRKSYLVELVGAPDYHIFCCTVLKESGSSTPVVELFDSTPQPVSERKPDMDNFFVVIDSTLASIKEAFAASELQFHEENFLTNREPFQASNLLCWVFAMEHAFNTQRDISSSGASDHIRFLLQEYIYKSPFSEGMIDLDVGSGYSVSRRLESATVALSQFNRKRGLVVGGGNGHIYDPEAAEEKRSFENLHGSHSRKSGEEESHAEHRERYLRKTENGAIINSMAEEKGLRRMCHLFEFLRFYALRQALEPEVTESVPNPTSETHSAQKIAVGQIEGLEMV